MITSFERHTQPLSDFEKNELVPVIIERLKKTNKNSPATSRRLCSYVSAKGYSCGDVRLRRCIKYIQMTDLLNWVVGTGDGFFYTQDKRIVLEQIRSLRGREQAISAVRMVFENALFGE